MRQKLRWMTVAVLCCAAGAVTGAKNPDDRLQQARTAFSEALAIQEEGQYARAEPLLQRALALYEAALGKSHPDVATSLNNLANLYSDQGLYERAEPLYQRALALHEAALGEDHPTVAISLNNLAIIYSEQGLYERAAPLVQRALAINEAALCKNHPGLVRNLNNLAQTLHAQQRLPEALPLFTRAFTFSEQRLRLEALDFSESRLATFLQYLRSDEEQLYSLLRAHPDDAGVRPYCPRSATPAACSSLPMASSASSPSPSSTTVTASSWTPSTSPTSPRARTCCPAPRA